MAAQARRKQTLKTKIDELNDIRKQMNDYVDQMTGLGTSWINSQGTEGSYQDITAQLESSIDLLYEMMDKLVGAETTASSFTLEAKPANPVASGTTLEDILNRMNVLENGGNALHSQVGRLEETLKSWARRQNECERRLTEAQRQLTRSETRHDLVEERMTKSETALVKSEGQLQELEKWRQDHKKEMGEVCIELGKTSASTEGGAVGAGLLLPREKGQGFTASMAANSQPVDLTPDQTVTCLSHLTKNCDPSIGTYIARVSGKYKITLSHTQCQEDDEGFIKLRVVRNPGVEGSAGYVGCETITWGSECEYYTAVRLQDTCEVVEMLSAGDRLSVQVWDVWAGARLTNPCSFSCELLAAD